MRFIAPLMMCIVDEEGLVAAGDDIDNRIADAQDVELVHSVSSLLTAVVLRSRSSLIGFWSGWNPAKGACRAEAQFFPGSASRRLSSYSASSASRGVISSGLSPVR
jgi:hypothetical protein